MKTVVKEPEAQYDNAGSNNGLRNSQDHSCSKKRPTSRPIPHSFRACDECGDRIVEAKNANLADNVSSRPGNRKYTERCRPKYPGHEKREYAAEIRGQHRDRVQEGSAF
jgi:hypothetical protein